MNEENVASETQSTEAPSLRDEMIASLKTSTEAEEKSSVETETDNEAVNEEDISASGEEEVESDESEEESEESVDTKPEDKKSKPTRWQRMKARAQAQVEEAKHQADKFANERDEAVKIANVFNLRAKALEQKLNQFIQAAQQGEVSLSPVEAENFQLRLMQQEQQFAQQYEHEIAKSRQEAQIHQRVASLRDNLTAEAYELSAKFTGAKNKDFARKVLQSYAAAIQADPNATLEQTARLVHGLSTKSVEREQLAANSSAPKPRTSSTKGTTPQFKDIREEMAYFLKAKG